MLEEVGRTEGEGRRLGSKQRGRWWGFLSRNLVPYRTGRGRRNPNPLHRTYAYAACFVFEFGRDSVLNLRRATSTYVLLLYYEDIAYLEPAFGTRHGHHHRVRSWFSGAGGIGLA